MTSSHSINAHLYDKKRVLRMMSFLGLVFAPWMIVIPLQIREMLFKTLHTVMAVTKTVALNHCLIVSM